MLPMNPRESAPIRLSSNSFPRTLSESPARSTFTSRGDTASHLASRRMVVVQLCAHQLAASPTWVRERNKSLELKGLWDSFQGRSFISGGVGGYPNEMKANDPARARDLIARSGLLGPFLFGRGRRGVGRP